MRVALKVFDEGAADLGWGQPSGVLGMRSPRRIALVLASRAAIVCSLLRRFAGVQQCLLKRRLGWLPAQRIALVGRNRLRLDLSPASGM